MSRITRGYWPIKSRQTKLKNRRIRAGLMVDGSVVYHFKNLVDGDIRAQKIKLSPEAIITMFQLAADLGALKGNVI